jgi:hypothetical protein
VLVEQREEERAAVAEAAEQRRLPHPRRLGDLLERDVGDPALGEERTGGFEDAGAIASGIGALGPCAGEGGRLRSGALQPRSDPVRRPLPTTAIGWLRALRHGRTLPKPDHGLSYAILDA